MTLTIIEPGFYSLKAEDYHRDPVIEPSLSASIAIPLLHRSPRHAWQAHPRLNPDYEPDDGDKKKDIGTAAHALLFQAGRDIDVLAFDDYRKKDAQLARDASYEAGRTPVLTADYEKACAMADLASEGLRDLLGEFPGEGHNEAVMVWREGDAWCRSMVDHISADFRLVVDLKTSARSANPDDCERRLYDEDKHFKAAFYERGLDVLDPANRGRRRTYFMFQETEPPYEFSFLEPTEGGMMIARKQVTAAIQLWQRCIAKDEWPGYSRLVHRAACPPWIEQRWLQREMTDPMLTGATSPDGDRIEPESNRQIGGWTP
jgi:hypothetical protein